MEIKTSYSRLCLAINPKAMGELPHLKKATVDFCTCYKLNFDFEGLVGTVTKIPH